MTRLRYAEILAALCMLASGSALVVACGDDGESSGDSEALRDLAEQYFTASAGGDPSVCDLLSASELQRVASVTGGSADALDTCRAQVRGNIPLNDDVLRSAANASADAETSIDGNTAVMTITGLGQSEPDIVVKFVRVEGGWKVDGQT